MIDKNTLEFPLNGSVTLDDVKKMQSKILEIAIFVKTVLEKNDIPYTIMFGSLLGAVRHGGFIPWDLDFDMGVLEEDYDRAMAAIEKELPSDYVIQNTSTDSKYCAFWSKIVDRYSEVISSEYPSDNEFLYKGVHVDIYKLKHTSSIDYKYDLLKDNLAYYQLKYEKHLLSENDFEKYSCEINNQLIGRLACKSDVADEIYFLNFFKSKVCDVFPTKEYVFEGYSFCGPNNFDVVLNNSGYDGDYMMPPPYEKRDIKIVTVKFLK